MNSRCLEIWPLPAALRLLCLLGVLLTVTSDTVALTAHYWTWLISLGKLEARHLVSVLGTGYFGDIM